MHPGSCRANPPESPLIKFVTGEDKDLRMPPEGDLLSAAEIATLTRWIDEGAAWPDDVDPRAAGPTNAIIGRLSR